MSLPSLPQITSEDTKLADDKLQDLSCLHSTSDEMMAFYDDTIVEGSRYIEGENAKFWPWQIKVNQLASTHKASAKHPFKFALCAANGSGKDSFFVAPFAVFMSLCNIKCTVVITSSSGPQLTMQTERYIKALCEKINLFWQEAQGTKIFKVTQRHIKCILSGSEIILFATDESGRAEGFHPIEPNRKFVIIANEAKSIEEPIFEALGRCNGFTHYIMVSSPGEPKGSFHYSFTHWPYIKRIRSLDCPHINPAEREEDKDKYGENSAYFRSKHEALFTSIGGSIVITDDNWNKCLELCKIRIGINWPKEIGIDLAAGGDECVISIWQGNQRVYRYAFIEKDTMETALIISRELKSQGIEKTSTHIKADDGGVGKGIIDNLRKIGWNIRRIMNQTPAFNKQAYGNRGAENWFNVKRMFEECFLLLKDPDGTIDRKTKDQFTSRHFKQTEGGNNRLFLQSKQDARAEGHPSPDRADADVLALMDYRVEKFFEATKEKVEEPDKPQPSLVPDVESLVSKLEEKRWQEVEDIQLENFANAEILKGLRITSPDFMPFDDPQKYSEHLDEKGYISKGAQHNNTTRILNSSLSEALGID